VTGTAAVTDGAAGPAERLAPAKINLGLAITGTRADGHHELRSVFLRIGLTDTLGARLAPEGGADSLRIDGDDECPVDGNIVLRAAALLRAWSGHDLAAIDFSLEKRIPMAAGLGGGSSDAAAALDLAAHLWSLSLPLAERLQLAAELGADVPFFATQVDAALVGGIGDVLLRLPGPRGGAGILLVTPSLRLSTAEVFEKYETLVSGDETHSTHAVEDLARALTEGLDGPGLEAHAHRLRGANDLWPAALALAPELGGLRSELERVLDRPVLLSGSGSTLFALYASQDEATAAGESLVAVRLPALARARLAAAGVDINQPSWRFS
jgi:4-diphosphocytidyl-2-C-methyl-D-erythritol kinase